MARMRHYTRAACIVALAALVYYGMTQPGRLRLQAGQAVMTISFGPTTGCIATDEFQAIAARLVDTGSIVRAVSIDEHEAQNDATRQMLRAARLLVQAPATEARARGYSDDAEASGSPVVTPLDQRSRQPASPG